MCSHKFCVKMSNKSDHQSKRRLYYSVTWRYEYRSRNGAGRGGGVVADKHTKAGPIIMKLGHVYHATWDHVSLQLYQHCSLSCPSRVASSCHCPSSSIKLTTSNCFSTFRLSKNRVNITVVLLTYAYIIKLFPTCRTKYSICSETKVGK
jgi:hypothetical protein